VVAGRKVRGAGDVAINTTEFAKSQVGGWGGSGEQEGRRGSREPHESTQSRSQHDKGGEGGLGRTHAHTVRAASTRSPPYSLAPLPPRPQLEWMGPEAVAQFDTHRHNPFQFKHVKCVTSLEQVTLPPRGIVSGLRSPSPRYRQHDPCVTSLGEMTSNATNQASRPWPPLRPPSGISPLPPRPHRICHARTLPRSHARERTSHATDRPHTNVRTKPPRFAPHPLPPSTRTLPHAPPPPQAGSGIPLA
jgi:hypothetical protein